MNIGYFIVLWMFLIVTQLPCFISLMIFYPLYKLFFKRKIFLAIPRYLFNCAFQWTDDIFFKVQHVKTVDYDTTKRYVYLPNHQAYVDPVIRNDTKSFFVVTIATGYVKIIPVFGQNAYLMDTPFVGKDKGITQMYTDYLNKHSDRTLALFPEGHRNFDNDFKFKDIKTGGFVIAKNTGHKIIPLFHNMMDRINDKNKEYHALSKIYCLYGKPIEVEGREIEDIKKEYYDQMIILKNMIDELRKL